jgi:hypothetical protein
MNQEIPCGVIPPYRIGSSRLGQLFILKLSFRSVHFLYFLSDDITLIDRNQTLKANYSISAFRKRFDVSLNEDFRLRILGDKEYPFKMYRQHSH